MEHPPILQNLDDSTYKKLQSVNDYVIDYNINVYKKVNELIRDNNQQLKDSLMEIFENIPDEYKAKIFNPIKNEEIAESMTLQLQNRILSLLIQERHRRDIQVLNERLPEETQIKYIKLQNPQKYEIKSAFYNTFKNDDDNDDMLKYLKIAMIQSIEYDFENKLTDESDFQNDNQLIEFFVEGLLGIPIDEDIISKEIVRLIIPLASSVILSE